MRCRLFHFGTLLTLADGMQQNEIGWHQFRRRQPGDDDDLLAGPHGRVVKHAGFHVRQHGFDRIGLRDEVGRDAVRSPAQEEINESCILRR